MDIIPQLVTAFTVLAALVFTVFVVLAAQITSATARRGMDTRCPSCGMRDVRSSSQRALRDYLFGLFCCAPYRCRTCGTRFYWYTGERPVRTDP